MSGRNLVLRTMYIDPDVDDQLRTEAFDSRTSKNDLLRKYLRLGMAAAKTASENKVTIKTIAPKQKVAPVTVKPEGKPQKIGTPVAGKTAVAAAVPKKSATKAKTKIISR